METLQAPMREVEARFTKSELFVIGWRSREVYGKMQQRNAEAAAKNQEQLAETKEQLQHKELWKAKSEFYNEQGELDLSQVTGEKAWNYLMKQGIHIPMIG